MQLQLMDWLEQLTFPEEAKFQHEEYAAAIYSSVVERYLRSGTTTACIYATLHVEGTCITYPGSHQSTRKDLP